MSIFVVCVYIVLGLTMLYWITTKGAHPWEILIHPLAVGTSFL